MKRKQQWSVRFTTNGAFGDVGSFDVDDEEDEDWPLLRSPEKADCLQV